MDTHSTPALALKLRSSREVPRTSASFNISGHAYDVLAHYAGEHGVSIGIAARDLALRLIQMQKEDAKIGQGTGDERELIHTQIAGLEKRMAATVTTLKDELADLKAQNAILLALLDAFAATYLVHTPPVPEELRAEQAESGGQRYDKLLTRVAAAIQGASGQSAVLERIQAINLGV